MATQNAQARTVTAAPASKGLVNVSSLVLLAILLAAGFILNMTVGNALAVTGIKPQFIIAAYALAIALTQASFAQAAIFGILSAAVIQITTSIPGLNIVTELAGALTMVALVKSNIGGDKINPFIAGLLTTLVSGALFAALGTVIMGAALPTALAKVPIVLGTAVFNAVVVQALFFPLCKVLGK
ncbi:MAG: hypothetical protein EGR35_11230 [Collinsella aerofaciens]|uniref:Uncharacterized protein n=1 Tax=Collinsella aerofaciens TaxID=74426 RepID=A0A5K1IUL7_9ACTN|nr:hypothetical protein [Collinsella aerofaciens]MBD9040350.1 hypothetical protein [Collinsella aerofaciens]MBD9040881.1 hypothetical protein [Collinsella aerofaciens]VWL92462.1 Uncharacterised protein [Collinsella aerofaciens]